jgi:hypothetical protein
MIEKHNKTYFMLGFTAILAIIALVYGFSTIPSPAQERLLQFDHRRVSDLGKIQYSIDDYFRTNEQLPHDIDSLHSNVYSYSESLSKADPETKQPYEYQVLTPNRYRLCALFMTDSRTETYSYSYDDENYNYSSFKRKFEHPKGPYCFDFTTPILTTRKLFPLPTLSCSVGKLCPLLDKTPSATDSPHINIIMPGTNGASGSAPQQYKYNQ